MNKSKCKFFKSPIFSLYYSEGIFWFKIFNVGLSFKHVHKYKFIDDNVHGFYIGYWLINII